jgi:thioredoxin 1
MSEEKQENRMNDIIELEDQTFDREVTQADVPVLVDFYAPWCGPCRMLAPVLDALAPRFAGRVKFAKVNVDRAPGLAMRYRVTGVPTLIIFKRGLVLDTIVGVPSPGALKARLEEVAALGAVPAPEAAV